MTWYYSIAGGHTHVRVFVNWVNCGKLCFRNEEFQLIRRTFGPSATALGSTWTFINETGSIENDI